jgi:hypothetical protein
MKMGNLMGYVLGIVNGKDILTMGIEIRFYGARILYLPQPVLI